MSILRDTAVNKMKSISVPADLIVQMGRQILNN